MEKLEKVPSSTVNKPRAVQRNVCLFQLKEGKLVLLDHCAKEHNMHLCMQEQVHTQ